MYRTTDPRFRRRLHDISQTLESANESAQSNLYIFAQSYVRPCFGSIGDCFYTCVDASCPTLNLQNRDRLRRQRGRARSRGRAELNFDFYDDWDGDEEEGLLGWGGDDFGTLTGSAAGGYGTVSAQPPAGQRGMSYPSDRRRKSVHEGTAVEAMSGPSFLSRLFGKSKAARYRPTAADLQEHPGGRGKHNPESEALLEGESSPSSRGHGIGHRRVRSATVASSTGSYSSRGDIFPSDDEDDAVPLDDEFAMVLERRNTGGQSVPETESSSGRTGSARGKMKVQGSRGSSRRTMSARSDGGVGARGRSRAGTAGTGTGSSLAQTPVQERTPLEELDIVFGPVASEPPASHELLKAEASSVDEDAKSSVSFNSAGVQSLPVEPVAERSEESDDPSTAAVELPQQRSLRARAASPQSEQQRPP